MAIEDKLAAAQRALDELAWEIRDRHHIGERGPARSAAELGEVGALRRTIGDTADAVQSRRKTGKWLDGRECKMVDGRLWIDLRAVEAWLEAWP